MYAESLAAYKLIVKKRGPLARRLHVNVGNIHMAQGSFSEALKEYQKALDNLPPGGSCTRARVQTNIGLAHVRLGAYQEAITSFTNVMEVRPSFQAAFNLVVCFFAMGDTELMVKGLDSLLALPLPLQEEAEDKEEDEEEGKEVEGGGGDAGGGVGAAGGGGGGGGGSSGEGHISAAAAALSALAPRDALRDELQVRQVAALNAIKLAARLIAPELGHGGDWAAGFDDVVRRLRLNHPHCASELQICKALQYLRRKEFSRAIEELKAFEKRDAALKAKAANNLAFLYLLENDVAQAAKFAALAVRNDRYNARALVNMGNALVEERGELEKAKELYLEAIGVEADCVEAIFNLGLVNRQLGALGEAIQAFEKLHTLVPAAPEVLHHLAVLHEATDNYDAAQKYAALLVSRCPTDSGALARLGQLYARMAAAASGTDGCSSLEAQAFHYTAEAYRVFPVNLEVISWLGVWYVKSEMYERAIEFFMRASELQPGEVKWRLMVASCHRCVNPTHACVRARTHTRSPHPPTSHLPAGAWGPCPRRSSCTKASTSCTPTTLSACATWWRCRGTWASEPWCLRSGWRSWSAQRRRRRQRASSGAAARRRRRRTTN
jgi:intraflagellar transport protein 88